MLDENKPAVTITSAGVIPYAFSPFSTNVYFLLGKEGYTQNWPAGSNKWCDLGGTLERRESVTSAAARECVEECMGLLQLHSNPRSIGESWTSTAQLQAELEGLRYTYRIQATSTMCPSTRNNKLRMGFLKQVPWQPNIPAEFKMLRNIFKVLQAVPAKSFARTVRALPDVISSHPAVDLVKCRIRHEYMEKRELQWWSLPHLREALANNGHFRQASFRRSFLPTLAVMVSKFQEIEGQLLPKHIPRLVQAGWLQPSSFAMVDVVRKKETDAGTKRRALQDILEQR